MTPILTVFADSPDGGRGLARDMSVRWAFEEVGQPYDVRPVPWKQFEDAAHRARNPFAQIPTLEEGDLTLFESGAIVLHIAERHSGLLPADADARTRAIMWIFAALTTVQGPIIEREGAIILEKEKPWFADRMPILDERVRTRLRELSHRLGSADWLDGEFSAGDLLMICVLRRHAAGGIIDEFPNLVAYVDRGMARPAFQRAFAAQKAVFDASKSG